MNARAALLNMIYLDRACRDSAMKVARLFHASDVPPAYVATAVRTARIANRDAVRHVRQLRKANYPSRGA